MPQDPQARSTGLWAKEDVKQFAGHQGGDAGAVDGPLGGRVRLSAGSSAVEPAFGGLGSMKSVPTDDVQFASSIQRRGGMDSLPPEFPNEVDDESTGAVVHRRPGGGLGKWIAIASLVLIAGAAIVIYALVLRGGGPERSTTMPAITSDAGLATTTLDAGSATPPAGDPVTAAATEALHADTAAGLEAALGQLTEGTTAEDPARLALRARLATAIVQDLEDEALFTGAGKVAEQLRADAKKRMPDAAALAQKALKRSAGSDAEALASVAMADVLRLQGKPAKDVEKTLARALELSPADREAKLVSALLAAREGRTSEARTILQQLDSGDGALEKSGDVRPRFRLAALAFAAGDKGGAQKAAEQVIAAQANHAGARALLARLREAVSTTDPMPPEDVAPTKGTGNTATTGAGKTGPATSGAGKTGPATSGAGKTAAEPRGDDYDALLAKADALADKSCGQAMAYYQRALAVKPNGVAALTGVGYCYIDAKQFSSAHSSFRAALAVSRRYEPALWGVAEAYQQQGLKEKAIEAYQDYLEAYPGTQKAIKQIEKLGGGGGESKPPEPKPEPEAPKPSGTGSDPASPSPS